MKTLRKTILLIATLGFLGATTGCSLFKKKDEDNGLTRWNESVEKPSRWQKWQKWEAREADDMWRKFRDD